MLLYLFLSQVKKNCDCFCLSYFWFQTDDLEGRIHSHRSKEGMEKASFLYVLVAGKSVACQMETLLINQLPSRGFHLTNIADGKHRNFGTTDVLGAEMIAR